MLESKDTSVSIVAGEPGDNVFGSEGVCLMGVDVSSSLGGRGGGLSRSELSNESLDPWTSVTPRC